MYFFFFKQKTAYEMRISDWSSDVCSSDLSVKDLFDMPGEVTTAGSKLLRDAAPATAMAPAIARLAAAGAVLVGKTNMTEFAFSGVGLHPHYATRGTPADCRRNPRGPTSRGARKSVGRGTRASRRREYGGR